jgi:uncharacterized protein YyaL (SSP411 family)
MGDGKMKNGNRLIGEKSPYLLLHASNPVDWFPWGEEAFVKAKREDKPVFLSVGYATCHWCHVMERESFVDEEIARILNRDFVSVKVDREERPDIDQIYMAACQLMTGRGGWPLTVLMTPDREPFFAATYLPKTARFGQPGLGDLLEQVSALWKTDRRKVLDSAGEISGALERNSRKQGGAVPGESILEKAYGEIAAGFDEEHGGFGRAPKFPVPHMLQFLLRYGLRRADSGAHAMVRRTLTAFRRGGIYDQLGFGFHRYSTDRAFLLPHFEKMLYDQALLSLAFLEAYEATGESLFAETAREIFTYVARDMTSSDGGFFSAEDADSEGEEGKFYVWSHDEILRIPGKEGGEALAGIFNAKPAGNFNDEASGEPMSVNILHLTEDPPDDAAFRKGRDLLFQEREERVRPLKDDKVLTSWNGLMIAALARGGAVLGEDSHIRAAGRAARFVLEVMSDERGRLWRRYREGEAALPGFLSDYAFFVHGLIELYQATFTPRWLAEAVRLNREMIDLFGDGEGGGLFFSGKENERLLTGVKETYDGALPSGNSVALLNFLRLGRLTGDREMDRRAEELVRAFAGEIEESPAGHTMMLTALDFTYGPTKELVIVGPPEDRAVKLMIEEARRGFRPNLVVLLRPPGAAGKEIVRLAPYTGAMKMEGGRPTAYLCENFACREPITDLEELRRALA